MSDDASPRMIAVAGKGGTGKTVTIAVLARLLAEREDAGRLLLIDADPAGGLLCALGIEARRTMGEVREAVIRTAKGADSQAKAELADKVEYLAFEALTEMDGFSVLAMGRTETLGCYCPVNSLLRQAIKSLSLSFDTILIDGEAGLEQINRQVVRHLDALVVVSDPTARGLETASMIKKMIDVDRAIRCEKLGLVFNRVNGNREALAQSAERIGIDVFGMIPYDETVAEFDFAGTPITGLPADSTALTAYAEVIDKHLLPTLG